MSTVSSMIPKAGQIDVPNPPEINSVDFIKQVVENINAQLLSIDKEVGYASQGDSAYVKALYDSIHEMKSRAEQADMILTEVLNDKKKLEFSIARIEGPGETFHNIKKFEASVQELEKELKEGEYDYYRVVADLLIETHEKKSKFEPYSAIPHIALINRKVTAIETELKRQVQWSFREIGPLANADSDSPKTDNNVDLSYLSQVYLVVDALGPAFRKDLLERFAQLQLIPYEKNFKLGSKSAGLENLEERYAWFKYLLSVVEDKLSDILQPHWHAPSHLFIEFSRRTNKHITDVLTLAEKESHDPNTHVTFLLKSLKSVLAFEAEIKASFSVRDRVEEEEDEVIEIKESISDAFDPFLGPYVQLEREGLEKLMSEMMRTEDISDKPDEAAVPIKPGEIFESSRKLFEYIKGSLKRCTSFSTGLTFLSLSKEFRISLQQYAESLKFRCPNPIIMKSGKAPIYSINKHIEANLCRIICTGEYCIDTIPALESMMKQKINPSFESEVDFSSQVDAFMDMVSFTMNVLASGEVYRMDGDFQIMKKTDYSCLENVSDVDNYVKHMLKILSDGIHRIRLALSAPYFQNVCMKLATTFLDVYLENIMKLKRVSKNGGGQLLLDLNGIKEYLLKMPNAKLPEGTTPLVISKSYISLINMKVKKIEIVLKLVCTEDNMMEETFGVLWPDGSSNDLESVMSIKGSKRILPINSEALDKVGDVAKNISKTTGKITKGAVGDITSGITKVGGNLKNAVGDLFSGNLFSDNDGNNNTTNSTTSNSSISSKHNDNKTDSSFSDLKSGFNAAFGFKSNNNSTTTPNPEKKQTKKP